MGFYERYSKICTQNGLEPCSQSAAKLFGVTRATISAWNTKGTAPKGETVAVIAGVLGVSCDYLLERTDDPTDYSNPELIAEMSDAVLDELNGDVQRAVKFKMAVDKDALKERNGKPEILRMYEQLDDVDQAQVVGIIKGLLMSDKYKREKQA